MRGVSRGRPDELDPLMPARASGFEDATDSRFLLSKVRFRPSPRTYWKAFCMRFEQFAVVALACCFSTPALYGQRTIRGNTITSDTLPAISFVVDSGLTHLGRQRFVLYNVANADQFFFAELDGKQVKRFIWVQFEGYLPEVSHTYDYSRDSTTTMWGRTIYRNSTLRAMPVSETRPDSDGAKARDFLREKGLTLPPSMLYHRLVWLVDQPARNELMVIYMEDPADFGLTGGAIEGPVLQSLLAITLRRAEQSISIRPR